MDEGTPLDRHHIGGTIILFVLTAGFILGSFLWGSNAFKPLVNSFMATSWQPAEAVVVSSQMKQTARNQYVVEAEYTYRWDNQDYVSNKVFFDEMFGVRKNYYYNIHRQLSRHKSADNPVRIWVNPDRPQHAVIYRHIRWAKFAGNLLLFALWMAVTLVLAGASYGTLRDIFTSKGNGEGEA